MKELHTTPARELTRAMREGRLGVEELLRAYLARIARYDGAAGLNAVRELDEGALARARAMDARKEGREGPLYGLPILVKDNVDVAGLHTTAGSPALADNVAARDAAVVANLRRCGALILGKTNMTEFANYTSSHMPGGYSAGGGRVLNAYGRAFSPSGSSAGSAVAMAAGFCAAAVGTDTSFSVVGCATVNGVAGLKPPHGALSGAGIVPIAATLDSAGPLTRDFGDALLLYGGLRGAPIDGIVPTPISQLRLAVNPHNREMVSENQLAHYEALFAALRADGARFTELVQPHTPCQRDIMRCEFRRDLEAYLAASAARRKTLAEIVAVYEADPARLAPYDCDLLRAALAAGPEDEAYRAARRERERLRGEVLDALAPYDACVMTGPTNVMHFCGLPSLALPLCMGADGAPRGIILYGADEARLYAAALTIERYCPGMTPPRLEEA